MRNGGYGTRLAGMILRSLSGDRLVRIAARQLGAHRLPGTRLSLDQLKQQFFQVSAGRRLKPRSWPNNSRVAVAMSFDVDNATLALSRGDLRAADLSRGEYGGLMVYRGFYGCLTSTTLRPPSLSPRLPRHFILA
jgi:hypothetical protein